MPDSKSEFYSGLRIRGALSRRELKQQNRSLEKITRVDPLTGLANEKGIALGFARIANEFDRSNNPDESLLVIKADIKYFKFYDDLLTWAKGDGCLRDLGVMLEGNAGTPGILRSDTVVGRMGGDDFVIISKINNKDLAEGYKHPLLLRLLDVGQELSRKRRELDNDEFTKKVNEAPEKVIHALRESSQTTGKMDWDELGMMTLTVGGMVVSHEDLKKIIGEHNLSVGDPEKLLRLWQERVNPLVDSIAQGAKNIKARGSKCRLTNVSGETLGVLIA